LPFSIETIPIAHALSAEQSAVSKSIATSFIAMTSLKIQCRAAHEIEHLVAICCLRRASRRSAHFLRLRYQAGHASQPFRAAGPIRLTLAPIIECLQLVGQQPDHDRRGAKRGPAPPSFFFDIRYCARHELLILKSNWLHKVRRHVAQPNSSYAAISRLFHHCGDL
jgi:hypothetical protein